MASTTHSYASTAVPVVVVSVVLGVGLAAGLIAYGVSTGAGVWLWVLAGLWALFALAVPFGVARGRRLNS